MSRQTTFVIFAIIAALGLLGIVMIQASYTQHQVAAKGCPVTNGGANTGAIHSLGRCVH